MLDNLTSHGIRVFSYDIGEEGVFTTADEATNFRLALDQLGFGTEWMDRLQVGAQIDSVHAHQEVLSALGTETGGRFWRGQDYDSGLAAADDDLSHYYLIGYVPTGLLSTGKYAKIVVRHDKGKLRVVSRQGYYGEPAPVSEPPDIQVSATVTSPEEQTTVPDGPRPLEIDGRPLFYPSVVGKTLVVLTIDVAGPVDAIEIGNGVLALDIDLALSATSIEGIVAVSGDRNIRFQVRPKGRTTLEAGFQMREALLLDPGLQDLSVDVRLNGLGRSGSWHERYDVPGRPAQSFGLTEVALLSSAARTPLVYDVFRRGEIVFGTDPPSQIPDPLGEEASGRPPLYMGGGFPRTVPLLAQVGVIEPPAAGGEDSPLRMDWELIPTGGGVVVAPPVRYRRLLLENEGRRLDILVDLDLAAVTPGDYTLRLTAQNLLNDASDTRFYPISISP